MEPKEKEEGAELNKLLVELRRLLRGVEVRKGDLAPRRTPIRVLQKYTSELILGLSALGLGFLFTLVKNGGTPAGATPGGAAAGPTPETWDAIGYAVMAIGFQVTTAIFLLKGEFSEKLDELRSSMESRFDNRLDIYNLLWRIARFAGNRNELFISRAGQAVDRCKEELEGILHGTIRDSADTIFHFISEEVERGEEKILAVHVGYSAQHITRWNEGHMRQYYKRNIEAVKKNVTIKRIFILYRDNLLGEAKKLPSEVLAVLQKQADDGVKVFVVWEDGVKEKSYIEDFVMVDGKAVEYGIDAGGFVSSDWPHRDAFFSVNPSTIQDYVFKFERLENYALEFAEWKEENKAVL